MYSMVLLAALTTTVDTPDFGRRGGGGGCCGCYGGGYGGCYGGGWGGCYGGGWGGGYGGCYGGGWGGGYGGCYGGGWGGGYGGHAMGSWGGGYGGYASNWGVNYMPTYASLPMTTGTPVAGMDTTQPYQSFYAGTGGQADMGNRARIVVHVPADARVTIDGEQTQSTGEVRTFVSPPLDSGRTYHYTIRATMNNGDNTKTQNVQVWAGKTSEATFSFNNRSDNDRDRSERLGNPPADEDNLPRTRTERRPGDENNTGTRNRTNDRGSDRK